MSVIELADYDKRQIAVMQGKIKAFNAGKLRLNHLILDLESLLDLLESVDKEWKMGFGRQWETLEITYAVAASDENREYLSSDEVNAVEEAIKNIEKLIDQLNRQHGDFLSYL